MLSRFAAITVSAGSFEMTLVIGSVITAATGGNQQICDGFNALVSTSSLNNVMRADLAQPSGS